MKSKHSIWIIIILAFAINECIAKLDADDDEDDEIHIATVKYRLSDLAVVSDELSVEFRPRR